MMRKRTRDVQVGTPAHIAACVARGKGEERDRRGEERDNSTYSCKKLRISTRTAHDGQSIVVLLKPRKWAFAGVCVCLFPFLLLSRQEKLPLKDERPRQDKTKQGKQMDQSQAPQRQASSREGGGERENSMDGWPVTCALLDDCWGLRSAAAPGPSIDLRDKQFNGRGFSWD
jgi:hypothetical protein